MAIEQVFRAVWPIQQQWRPRALLIAEAEPDFYQLADAAGALITSPPRWRVTEGALVDGWADHDGQVLVAESFALPKPPTFATGAKP